MKHPDEAYWVFTLFFITIMSPFLFYWPQVAPYQNTVQLPPATPGALTTDVWSWDFAREGFYAFSYLIVFSGLFMIWGKTRKVVWAHCLILIIFGLWFITMGVFDIIAVVYANVDPSNVNFKLYNPARSLYYCCVYGPNPILARTCANQIATCAIPGGVLSVNPDFWIRIGVNVSLLLFVIVDLFFSTCSYLPSIDEPNVSAKEIKYMVSSRTKKHRILAI